MLNYDNKTTRAILSDFTIHWLHLSKMQIHTDNLYSKRVDMRCHQNFNNVHCFFLSASQLCQYILKIILSPPWDKLFDGNFCTTACFLQKFVFVVKPNMNATIMETLYNKYNTFEGNFDSTSFSICLNYKAL